ncbi:MAG TPA: hypothetical protein VMV27_10760 [Candidatus Binataceae bacterium]|nr:hypothetical protein [Candidatus Binataceae bacterium]
MPNQPLRTAERDFDEKAQTWAWSDAISPAKAPPASNDAGAPMTDPLIRLLGWRAMFIQGDPMVYDRLRWLRRHLRIAIVAGKRA